jgi:hypothetical protein
MPHLLSSASGLLMVAVTIVYLRQVIRGSSTPNPATWFIWLIVMSLNTLTYYFVSRGNIWNVLTPSAITLGVLLIFSYSFVAGKLGRVGALEVATFLLAVVVGIFWLTTNNSEASNLMMQIILLISFVPTIVGLVRGELKERALPWGLGVLSYGFLIAAILVGSEWTWVQLAYPLVNGVAGNGAVVLVIWLKPTITPDERS